MSKINVSGSAKVVDDKGNAISKEIASDPNFNLAIYKKYIKDSELKGVRITVKETFTHPNGKLGKDIAHCTLLLENNKEAKTHTISFKDKDGTCIKEYKIRDGLNIKTPSIHTFNGKTISGWEGFSNGMKAKENQVFYAIYK